MWLWLWGLHVWEHAWLGRVRLGTSVTGPCVAGARMFAPQPFSRGPLLNYRGTTTWPVIGPQLLFSWSLRGVEWGGGEVCEQGLYPLCILVPFFLSLCCCLFLSSSPAEQRWARSRSHWQSGAPSRHAPAASVRQEVPVPVPGPGKGPQPSLAVPLPCSTPVLPKPDPGGPGSPCGPQATLLRQ
jgi:hypothetical protein